MAAPADPTRVMGRRVLAVVVDGVIVLGPPIALVTSSLEFAEQEQRAGLDPVDFCDTLLDNEGDEVVCIPVADGVPLIGDRAYFGEPSAAGVLTLWPVAFVMYVLLQGLTGWTIGKLVTGIRVVREDGGRPGIGRAFLRWLLWIVDGLPFLIPGLVAFITGLTTTGHRRVGDMAAKTYVVRSGAAGRPVVIPGLTVPPTGAYIPPPPSAVPGPQWDEARGTYIQWDPEAMAWMQWDDATKAWNRVPGQPVPLPPPPPTPPPPPPPPL